MLLIIFLLIAATLSLVFFVAMIVDGVVVDHVVVVVDNLLMSLFIKKTTPSYHQCDYRWNFGGWGQCDRPVSRFSTIMTMIKAFYENVFFRNEN